MAIRCKYCNFDKLSLDIEYIITVENDTCTDSEIGTINAVCQNCTKEQYFAPEDLPESVCSSLNL